MTQRRPSPSGDNFHVRLPSGRPLAICEWMTQLESATYAVCDRPRLTREAYSDLRMIVDSVLCFLAQDGGNDDAPHADCCRSHYFVGDFSVYSSSNETRFVTLTRHRRRADPERFGWRGKAARQ